MARHHEKWHGDRRAEPQEGPDRPQGRVDDNPRVRPEERHPNGDGARSDGQQRHRDRAVELNHHRVGGVMSRLRGMPHPVHTERRGDHYQQHRREQPDRRREAADRRYISGNTDRRRRHDPGTHHRRKPVGRDVGERLGATPPRRSARRNVGGQRAVEDLGHGSQHRSPGDPPEDGSTLWGHKRWLWLRAPARRDEAPSRRNTAATRPRSLSSGRFVQPTGQVSRQPSRRAPTSRRRRRSC